MGVVPTPPHPSRDWGFGTVATWRAIDVPPHRADRLHLQHNQDSDRWRLLKTWGQIAYRYCSDETSARAEAAKLMAGDDRTWELVDGPDDGGIAAYPKHEHGAEPDVPMS